MKTLLHSSSLRYALALWLATVLAFLIAFIVQLEPAQWVGITVWIVFIQSPRMNYSKIIWWAFGTIVGAFMAVIWTVLFNQTPEVLILFLSLWLAACAAAATFVRSYRAYGAVLAGYTCAIVTMSAVDHPELIFRIAATRVSCIFIGMASAILFISILLPKNKHWKDTLHQLGVHLKSTLEQAARALTPDSNQPSHFTWRHIVDRLSTLEHTLDVTTAETADSRIHAPQARSLVATLFDLLAKAQAIELHIAHRNNIHLSKETKEILLRTQSLLTHFAENISPDHPENSPPINLSEIQQLKIRISYSKTRAIDLGMAETISDQFLLNRLDEILDEFEFSIKDWNGLFGPWTAQRESHLAEHRDYLTAIIYGARMFLAMGMVAAIWFITEWPSGSQLILFTAVVCSLLSLVDHAPLMGLPFLKSAVFCAIMAYIECFWLQQKAEGFVVFALMLGFFLLPAAYAYRHPRLIGGAVVSMLIFYGLSNPANQMNYDISAFLNNGLALLCATACGFFAFHAVPSLDSKARQVGLLRAVRYDLATAGRTLRFDQSWTSCMFDRLRLLHRAAGNKATTTEWLDAENEILISLQLGLRQRYLYDYIKTKKLSPEASALAVNALNKFRKIKRKPKVVADFIHSTCIQFEKVEMDSTNSISALGALAELKEMTYLLETPAKVYVD